LPNISGQFAVAARRRTILMKLYMIVCGVLLIGAMGCSQAGRDWRQAKASNTAAAYTDFIAKHPQDAHVSEARLSVDDLDWRTAKTENTYDGFNLYLTHHADGKHLADAKAGIEGLPLRLTISSVAVANKFQAYVGGGSNIEAPEPISFFGGGGGMPLVSIAHGTTFLAGEVSSTNGNRELVRIEVVVQNPTEKSESFKIGDLSFAVAGVRAKDFVAVGYNDLLCAMGDADRQKVKEIAVEVAPQSRRTLSYVFVLPGQGAQGELVLENATPVSFEIGKHSTK
jgi:hypothetical protein